MGILDVIKSLNKKESNNVNLNVSKIESKNKEQLDSEIEKRVDLVKKTISLQKKPIPKRAKVALVLDYSVSMKTLYTNGTVQSIIERILPLAIQFDDDGELDLWLFEGSYKRIGSINLNNYSNYIENEKILDKYNMGGTSYSPVMHDVIKKYTVEDPCNLPSYVLFITDGDNFDREDTDKVMKDSSKYPIFWQFLGIGKTEFKYLEKLDTMKGRKVDNANFFSVNNINNISDEKLYENILSEYPTWCSDAQSLGIIK